MHLIRISCSLELPGAMTGAQHFLQITGLIFIHLPALSLDLTNAFNIRSDKLSYAKLRVGLAKVGGDTDPYQLKGTYSAGTFNSISFFSPTSTLPPANLKPQETKSYEIGADLRFLKNRLSLDVTYYDQTTVNQILNVATSPTTGYTGIKLNAGEIENKGVEVMFTAKVLENKAGFNWNVSLNWAKNKDMVNKLYGGLQSYQISDGFGGCVTLGIPGQEWGQLWGLPFVRDPKSGNKIVVGDDGIPLTTNVAKSFGTVTPDWVGGITNSFSYGNFSLSFLVDVRMGGKFFSCYRMAFLSNRYVYRNYCQSCQGKRADRRCRKAGWHCQ